MNTKTNVTPKNVAYRRVSSVGQDTERQLFETGIHFDLEFEDKVSGKSISNRKGLQECIKSLEKGDTLYVHDISRAGRNTEEVLAFIRKLNERSINVKFYKEDLEFTGDSSNPMKSAISQMVLTVLAAVHTLFLANNTSAIKDGIKKAKAKGVKIGAASEKYDATKRKAHNTRVNSKAREWAEKYRSQVELMVNMRMTLGQMVNQMESLGLKTPTGKYYHASGVSNLCKYLEIERG